jgi:putative transposase
VKRKRFTEEQIIGILKQAEAGVPLEQLRREHGFSASSFYHWKAKFGGMEVSDAKKLRALEDENSRLKRIVADQALDIVMLKDLNSKKW